MARLTQMRAEALVDSNVIVAALHEAHPDHAESSNLFQLSSATMLAIAAHSYAEAFNTLTKRGGPQPLGWEPAEAWRSLEQFASYTRLVGLTPIQTFAAVGRYAESGGRGARLYDFLIGEAARGAGLKRFVTWNVRHYRGLFPELEVLTPTQA